MIAEDFGGHYKISNCDELKTILHKRYNSIYNGIWLSTEPEGASMSILVKDDLAYVHYFPEKDHPGFHSVGNTVTPKNEMTTFRAETVSQEQPIVNNAIIAFSAAINAATDFLGDPSQLPNAIEWNEL